MGTVAIENTLSDEIRQVAYIARNGELAWNRESIIKAIEEIVKKGFGILGGEVWTLIPVDKQVELHLTSGTLKGVPYKVSGGVACKDNLSGIYGWTTSNSKLKRNDMGYGEWSAKVAIQWIAETNIENIVLDEFKNHIFYNLTLTEI